MTVLVSERLAIGVEGDVAVVRRRARELAQAARFDAFASAAITTAASELSRNALVHGGGGYAVVEHVSEGMREGLRMVFVDEGPGILDIDRALRGGYSTGRSLGLGLSGSRRLVDEFHVETSLGRGTRVEVVKWARFRR
ncbi:MAG: ATP-binding protein [Myxococcales bacterium]|nr:ATP-binding protein [Myxococcales bacterium]